MTFGELQKQAFTWQLTDRESDEAFIFRGLSEEFQATMLMDLIQRMTILCNAAGLSADLLAAEVEQKRKRGKKHAHVSS